MRIRRRFTSSDDDDELVELFRIDCSLSLSDLLKERKRRR